MRSTDVADALAATFAIALLVWPVVTGAAWWGGWLAVSAVGGVAGTAAAWLARGDSVRGGVTLAIMLLPAGGLLVVNRWWGLAHLLAASLGGLAGRRRFPWSGW